MFFSISPSFDENKVFFRTWGEIESRLDATYYKKIYMDLEAAVLKITQYKLRHFVKAMAGGSTPKITESEQYYSNSTDGVSFLRVQNLSPEGLRLSDCKYINIATHEGILSRSKVFEGDLLIKITGVGRMAITSIAPKDFEGNINQHMVVVKTKNLQINEQIAAFLNSDIGEMLASRRSTGGTRPALDYKALRSIPIILNDSIPSIMDKAYSLKFEKENQAQALLNSINDYLLQELGIVLPCEEKNTLESRMFCVNSSKVLGNRFDPRKYTEKYQKLFMAIENAPYPKKDLREVILEDISGNWGLDEGEKGDRLISCLTIRSTEFDNKYNLNLDNNRIKYRKYDPSIIERISLSPEDILVEKSGGSDGQPVGRVAFIEKEMVEKNLLTYSNFIHKIVIDNTVADPRYIFEYLRLMHNTKVTEVMQTQTNGIRNLIMGEYFRQIVLLPDKDTQRIIAYKASKMREQAIELEIQANTIVEKAKKQVKKILLGGNL